MQDGKVATEIFRGWLMKWTNYIKGYQKRWFVLSNGLLSYYRYYVLARKKVNDRVFKTFLLFYLKQTPFNCFLFRLETKLK